MSILLILFLASFVYAITESKTKWKTVLLVLGTMAAFLGISYIASLFLLSPAAIGTLAGILIPITGIAASLILIRREKQARRSQDSN